MRKRWIAKIRRDEDENFQIRHHTFVCSQHFKDSNYEYSQFAGRRFLNADAVPSLFKCWESVGSRHLVKISKPRKANRLQQNRTTAAEPSHNSDSDPDMTELVGDTPSMEQDAPSDGLSDELEDISCENESADIMSNEEVLQGKLADKELQCKILQEKVRSLTQELEAVKLELKQCEFAIDNVRSSDIVFFTGFPSIEVFDQMLTYLNPGENGENVIMANQESQASTPTSSSKREMIKCQRMMLAVRRVLRLRESMLKD
ncbi:uncharacterized protein LOC135499382 [Lineus longissimus]|uniref:uncharacterized protein LOC135499382 n=1 Tax=Lineus longissimus TaxID=88925 RepID=UPI00315D48BC